jgi:predicted TIM-barrel fold metal-dependent hydrolase
MEEWKKGRTILFLSSSLPFLHSIFIHDDAARRVGHGSCYESREYTMIIDTHVHLFAPDEVRFPYHPKAPYRPAHPAPVEEFLSCMDAAGIDAAVLVHPAPYQDDHRYVLHCLDQAPERLRGTCLFDPASPSSPRRMEELVREHPSIVALRLHAYRDAIPPFGSPEISSLWTKAGDLGLIVQLHFSPRYALDFGRLIADFPDVPVLLDHLGRPGQGTAEEYEEVLQLARFERVYVKLSGVDYVSKEAFPHVDTRPVVRRVVEAFGSDRIVWGSCYAGGLSAEAYARTPTVVDALLDSCSEVERDGVRGETASRLFGFC